MVEHSSDSREILQDSDGMKLNTAKNDQMRQVMSKCCGVSGGWYKIIHVGKQANLMVGRKNYRV